MTRKKKGGSQRTCYSGGWYSDTYWQSAAYTRRMYTALRNQVLQMALMRFRWENLPDTCDERFLEYTLLFEGFATIAHPKAQPKTFYSTKAVPRGRWNIYQDPVRWDSYGDNGWRFNVTPRNGVLVYDNSLRVPMFDLIDLHVRELVDIMRTKQINRMHAKTPWIVKAPEDKALDATNLIKQVIGGEPAVLGTNALSDIEFTSIPLQVPYLGAELTADELNVWNRIYACLGISNLTFKAERQIEDEVAAQSEPTDLMALSPLASRRHAADKLNKRFGLDIHVVWRKDNESENYNLTHNLEALGDLLSGESKGLLEVMGDEQI